MKINIKFITGSQQIGSNEQPGDDQLINLGRRSKDEQLLGPLKGWAGCRTASLLVIFFGLTADNPEN